MTTAPAYAELTGMLSKAEGQKAYLEWIAHPVTQKVIAASRELARPRIPRSPDEIGITLGESLGKNDLLDFMISPTGATSGKMRGELPQVRYGVKPVNKGE
jgi:hypothetical protein